MATTGSDIKGSYPLPSYNYKVSIGSVTLGFSEVSGLQIKIDTVTFKQSPGEGQKGAGPVVMNMLAQGTPVTISLKRGVIQNKDLRYLYDWIASAKTNVIDKRDVDVYLLDETGTEIVGWRVLNAMPTSLDAPSFSASSNEAALESVQLFADGVEMVMPKA